MIAEQQNAAYEDTYGSRPSAGDITESVGQAASGLPKGSRPGQKPGQGSKSTLPQKRPQPPAGSRPGTRKGNLMDALAVFGGMTGG